MGGAIAHYTQAGVDVHLICATNGEEGDVDPEYLEGFDSKVDVRLAELDCAAEKLGIKQVYKFGYRDSGMMGAPENDLPYSLWQANPEVLTGQVVEIIRRVRPQVVVTFDPYGGYGHPDHIAIHRATLAAFAAAGDPARYPEQLTDGVQPYQPAKLYYTIFPRLFVRLAVWMTRLSGRDPRHMGRNNDMDFQAVLEATLPVHTRVDLRDDYDAWQAANACHASQSSPRQQVPVVSLLQRWLFGWQTFYRAEPAPNGHKGLERDLFEGLD
jgi:LmbE family N-acetylglucosaminyl deacetylase